MLLPNVQTVGVCVRGVTRQLACLQSEGGMERVTGSLLIEFRVRFVKCGVVSALEKYVHICVQMLAKQMGWAICSFKVSANFPKEKRDSKAAETLPDINQS